MLIGFLLHNRTNAFAAFCKPSLQAFEGFECPKQVEVVVGPGDGGRGEGGKRQDDNSGEACEATMLLRTAMESYIEQLRLSAVSGSAATSHSKARAAFQKGLYRFRMKNGHHEQSISRSLAASCLSEDMKEPRETGRTLAVLLWTFQGHFTRG
jgi:hypothetical protein